MRKPESKAVNPGFRLPTSSAFQLLRCVYAYAAIGSLRLAIPARGQRHEDVIVDRIGGDAVRIAVRRYILQPLPSASVDHAENRTGEHVSCGQIVPAVARIEPSLVDSSNEIDRGDDGACGAVDDVSERSELPSVMALAGNQEVGAGARSNAAGHAIGNREAVDHRGNTQRRTTRESVEGIDLIHRPVGDVGRTVCVRQQEMPGIGVEYHGPESGYSNLSTSCGNDSGVMARNVLTAEAYASARGSRGHTAEIGKLKGWIWARKTSIGVINAIVSVINDDVYVVDRRRVVVDLAENTGRKILGEAGVRTTGAIGRVWIDREAMLLLLSPCAVDDIGDIENRGKGQAGITVDNHQEVMRIAERIDGWGGASRSKFVTAKIPAGWIRKGPSVRRCLARTDADGTIVVGSSARNEGSDNSGGSGTAGG